MAAKEDEAIYRPGQGLPRRGPLAERGDRLLRDAAGDGQVRTRGAALVVGGTPHCRVKIERELRDFVRTCADAQPGHAATQLIGAPATLPCRYLERLARRADADECLCERACPRGVGRAQEDKRQVELGGRDPARLGEAAAQRLERREDTSRSFRWEWSGDEQAPEISQGRAVSGGFAGSGRRNRGPLDAQLVEQLHQVGHDHEVMIAVLIAQRFWVARVARDHYAVHANAARTQHVGSV